MSILDAILLGIIEGLTELLPVSSTGHLILLGRVLGHEGEAHKALDVVIQLGAVVALMVFFRQKLGASLLGLWRRDAAALRLWGALAAAFVPTAVAGLLLHRLVKDRLFGPLPVAGALIAGGIAMIAVERLVRAPGAEGVERVTVARGFAIGLCQCLSLWPGASRSMVTIVGGRLLGLDTKTAAEFSFLLAVPTLGAATLYDLYKSGGLISSMPGGVTVLAIGIAVSFAVTLLVVALFLRYVARIGLVPFGIYRVLLGAVVLWLVW